MSGQPPHSSQRSFRSHRSYPSLHHVSLVPLTSRLPIDEPPEHMDSQLGQGGESSPLYPYQPPGKTSYLSSSSVPDTPPLLSHSRSRSHVRQQRQMKDSSRALSDTDLQSMNSSQPLHNNNKGEREEGFKFSKTKAVRSPGRPDSEWLLRAGLALTSSTREEKGQSWLVKRDSSTSLVGDADYSEEVSPYHLKGMQWPRSAASTPAARSRRGSRSRGGSRQASRTNLSMTSLELASVKWPPGSKRSSASENRDVVPDFVDEDIRAELASIHGRDLEEECLALYPDSEDEIDEAEMQRLTQGRGLGPGSWIDRIVRWTLFGVEEEWSMPPAPDIILHTTHDHDDDFHADQELQNCNEDDDDVSPLDVELPIRIERPEENGGWADASWLFRVAKNAMLQPFTS